jgi:hypothetical protein
MEIKLFPQCNLHTHKVFAYLSLARTAFTLSPTQESILWRIKYEAYF